MTRILNYLQNKTKFADLCCVKPEIQAFHSHGIVKNVTNPPFLGAQYKKRDHILKQLQSTVNTRQNNKNNHRLYKTIDDKIGNQYCTRNIA